MSLCSSKGTQMWPQISRIIISIMWNDQFNWSWNSASGSLAQYKCYDQWRDKGDDSSFAFGNNVYFLSKQMQLHMSSLVHYLRLLTMMARKICYNNALNYSTCCSLPYISSLCLHIKKMWSYMKLLKYSLNLFYLNKFN